MIAKILITIVELVLDIIAAIIVGLLRERR
jgi:hypothetical protein